MKMLQVLTSLVKYGYYDDSEDIKSLLPVIHELLDGQDDYPTRRIKLGKLFFLSDYQLLKILNSPNDDA